MTGHRRLVWLFREKKKMTFLVPKWSYLCILVPFGTISDYYYFWHFGTKGASLWLTQGGRGGGGGRARAHFCTCSRKNPKFWKQNEISMSPCDLACKFTSLGTFLSRSNTSSFTKCKNTEISESCARARTRARARQWKSPKNCSFGALTFSCYARLNSDFHS